MKIWKSYGSEHSANLVMIGRFKEVGDAKETKELIDSIFEGIYDLVDFDLNEDRYSDDVMNFLRLKNIYILSPRELMQFRYDISVDIDGNEIIVRTDEDDVSGIQKLMLHNSAKVEVYSAHDYPESDNDK